MGQLEDIANDAAQPATAYVPPLQLTDGQPPPIAANGGLSYMSFDRDGDAGTAVAIEAALAQIAEGRGQALDDMLENAPPGPIETRWGVGFRRYAECLDYIREQGIEASEGGLALPLRYTVYEQPSYSVVSSNALWRDPARLIGQAAPCRQDPVSAPDGFPADRLRQFLLPRECHRQQLAPPHRYNRLH